MVSALEFWSIQLHSTYSCQQGSCEMEDWSLSYHPNQAGLKGYQVGGKGDGGPKGNSHHCFVCSSQEADFTRGRSLHGFPTGENRASPAHAAKPSREGRGRGEGGVEAQPSPVQSPGCCLLLTRWSPLRSTVRFRFIQDPRALVPPLPCNSRPHTPSLSSAHLWEVLPQTTNCSRLHVSTPSAASSIISSFHIIFAFILVFNFLFGNHF